MMDSARSEALGILGDDSGFAYHDRSNPAREFFFFGQSECFVCRHVLDYMDDQEMKLSDCVKIISEDHESMPLCLDCILEADIQRNQDKAIKTQLEKLQKGKEKLGSLHILLECADDPRENEELKQQNEALQLAPGPEYLAAKADFEARQGKKIVQAKGD
jgi:hypothetical protein